MLSLLCLAKNNNLNWNIHHDAILAKAYRILGLVQRTLPVPSQHRLMSTYIHYSLDLKYYTGLLYGNLA